MTQNLNLKKGLKKGKTRHSPYFTNADVFPVAASVLAGRGDIRKYVTILRPPHQGAFAPGTRWTDWLVCILFRCEFILISIENSARTR